MSPVWPLQNVHMHGTLKGWRKVWAYLCVFSYCSIKDVVGYDPEVMLAADVNVGDFLHPSDQGVILPMRNFCKWGLCFTRRLL